MHNISGLNRIMRYENFDYITKFAWSAPPHPQSHHLFLTHSEHPLTMYLHQRWQEQKAQNRCHRLMAGLYKFALYTIIILIGQNMLTLRNLDLNHMPLQ